MVYFYSNCLNRVSMSCMENYINRRMSKNSFFEEGTKVRSVDKILSEDSVFITTTFLNVSNMNSICGVG